LKKSRGSCAQQNLEESERLRDQLLPGTILRRVSSPIGGLALKKRNTTNILTKGKKKPLFSGGLTPSSGAWGFRGTKGRGKNCKRRKMVQFIRVRGPREKNRIDLRGGGRIVCHRSRIPIGTKERWRILSRQVGRVAGNIGKEKSLQCQRGRNRGVTRNRAKPQRTIFRKRQCPLKQTSQSGHSGIKRKGNGLLKKYELERKKKSPIHFINEGRQADRGRGARIQHLTMGKKKVLPPASRKGSPGTRQRHDESGSKNATEKLHQRRTTSMTARGKGTNDLSYRNCEPGGRAR